MNTLQHNNIDQFGQKANPCMAVSYALSTQHTATVLIHAQCNLVFSLSVYQTYQD
jgi:hypothetical protein